LFPKPANFLASPKESEEGPPSRGGYIPVAIQISTPAHLENKDDRHKVDNKDINRTLRERVKRYVFIFNGSEIISNKVQKSVGVAELEGCDVS